MNSCRTCTPFLFNLSIIQMNFLDSPFPRGTGLQGKFNNGCWCLYASLFLIPSKSMVSERSLNTNGPSYIYIFI